MVNIEIITHMLFWTLLCQIWTGMGLPIFRCNSISRFWVWEGVSESMTIKPSLCRCNHIYYTFGLVWLKINHKVLFICIWSQRICYCQFQGKFYFLNFCKENYLKIDACHSTILGNYKLNVYYFMCNFISCILFVFDIRNINLNVPDLTLYCTFLLQEMIDIWAKRH